MIKRIIVFIGLVLLLIGCGQTLNENISEELEQDTQQILTIYQDAIDEDRLPTEKEMAVMEDYQLKYGARYNQGAGTQLELTQEENRVYLMTDKMIDMQDSYLLLDSGADDFDNIKYLIEKALYD